MKIRHIYLAGRKIKVGDGSITLFWLDCWINDKPLYLLYPTLFELCEAKLITVKKFSEVRGNISFRRWLPPFLQQQWVEVIKNILPLPGSMSLDTISWKWSTTGAFTVKSTYDRLIVNNTEESFSRIWKAKLPYKIKNFLWLVENGAILTKDNMVKRGWQGDPSCRFCENIETIQHLFFECSLARVVWSIVAIPLKANNIPTSLRQYWNWCRE